MDKRLKILTVEGEKARELHWKAELSDPAFCWKSVRTVSEALRYLLSETWDALLLDWQTVGVAGLDQLGNIRRSAPHTAVLFVGVPAGLAMAARSVAEGAVGFLSGPVRASRLRRTIERAQSAMGGCEHVYTLHLTGRRQVDLRGTVNQLQRELLDWALGAARGNLNRAAGLLDLPRTTLQSKLLRLFPGSDRPGIRSHSHSVR